MPKPLCGSQQTVENFKEMGIPDLLTCLLRNPCVHQDATVRTRHGTIDWFQVGKGVHQGCILSLCLFNLYAESVQFSCSVESDSLRPPELQHARPPCPSPTPGVHTHVYQVGDAIQPSHHLSSSSPPAFNLFHHQGLFQ